MREEIRRLDVRGGVELEEAEAGGVEAENGDAGVVSDSGELHDFSRLEVEGLSGPDGGGSGGGKDGEGAVRQVGLEECGACTDSLHKFGERFSFEPVAAFDPGTDDGGVAGGPAPVDR